MAFGDLIPWSRSSNQMTATYPEPGEHPFLSLHRDMNRLFDDVFRGASFRSTASSGAFPTEWPSIDVSESEAEIRITAELPGLEDKDIELTVEDGVLKLCGEKRAEFDDETKRFSERTYGRFERRISVGSGIEQDRIKASFRRGVLEITLPKTENARSKARRIAIKS